MSRINIRKHRDPLRVLSEYYIGKYILDGYVLLPKLYRRVEQIDEHRRREWVMLTQKTEFCSLLSDRAKRI